MKVALARVVKRYGEVDVDAAEKHRKGDDIGAEGQQPRARGSSEGEGEGANANAGENIGDAVRVAEERRQGKAGEEENGRGEEENGRVWLQLTRSKFELIIAVCVLAGALVMLILIKVLGVVQQCFNNTSNKPAGAHIGSAGREAVQSSTSTALAAQHEGCSGDVVPTSAFVRML